MESLSWTGVPEGRQSIGSQRVRHDRATNAFTKSPVDSNPPNHHPVMRTQHACGERTDRGFQRPGEPRLELSGGAQLIRVRWRRGPPPAQTQLSPPAFVCRGGDLLAGSHASLFHPLNLAFAPNGRQRGPAGPRRTLVSICGQDRA